MKPLSVEKEKAGKVSQGSKVSSPLLKYFEARFLTLAYKFDKFCCRLER